MNIITDIQLQVKNKNRFNVYIDDEYSFSCDPEIILKYKLKKGSQVSKKELLELMDENKEKTAFQIAIYYLSFRPRTYFEVNNYLQKKEYEDKIINKVLEKLVYYRYIDDRQYTMSYISNAIQERKKSLNSIKSELMKKGVSTDIIEELITLFSPDINLEIAKEISNKYFYQKSHLPFNQIKNKLSQMLIRKGFTWEVVTECLNYLTENNEIQSAIDSNRNEYMSQAIKLAEKYFDKYKKKENNSYLLDKKVKYALYQKGYDIDIIDTALESIKKNS